ncbi:hypothetical protein B0H63DRAFT_524405 [Podospora didyma]|uniref:Uncharacterized protein n=1 Tax=Podospora didyma TaxID=330526 RepID=A0AAE0NHN6_9PEZI|nr:hypothetical protein B0H63DRAFT_524405 [Podospora didyma]
MSDNKKKGAAGDNAPSGKSTSKGASKIFEALNKLCGVVKELKDDTGAVEEFSELVDSQKKLSADLKAKEDELQGLRTEKDIAIAELKEENESLKNAKEVLWKEFFKKQSEFGNNLALAKVEKKEFNQLQSTLQVTAKMKTRLEAENKKLQKELSQETKALMKTCSLLKDTENERDRLKHQHAIAQQDLDGLKNLLKEDRLEDFNPESLGNSLEEFAKKCHATVFKSFKAIDVPPASLPALHGYLASLPISSSTSNPAQLMRCAAAEAVFSKALVDHIFVDIYLGVPSLQHAISATLDVLQSKSERRERLARSLLLAEFGPDQGKPQYAVKSAKEDCNKVLDPLIPAGPIRDAFYKSLDTLLNEAVELWEPVQRSKQRVSVELDLSLDLGINIDEEEDSFPEYGAIKTREGGGGGERNRPVLLLRPQICMGQEILLPAVALWSNQAALVEAKDEAAAIAAARNSRPRASVAIPRRRPSVNSSHAASPRPTSTPSSPSPLSIPPAQKQQQQQHRQSGPRPAVVSSLQSVAESSAAGSRTAANGSTTSR